MNNYYSDNNNSLNDQTFMEFSSLVSRYFMEFLETDFKSKSSPRRKIAFLNKSGYRSGVRISQYNEFNKTIWKILNDPAFASGNITIPKSKFIKKVNTNSKIAEKIKNLNPKIIEKFICDFENFLQININSCPNLENLNEKTNQHIFDLVISMIVDPLFESNIEASDKKEIADSILDEFKEALLSHVSAYFNSKNFIDFKKFLEETITLAVFQEKLNSYLENFNSTDIFDVFHDFSQLIKTSDNQQLYLYFGSLNYDNNNYPLFFVPINFEKINNKFELKTGNNIYINKSAIDFVLNKISKQNNRLNVSPISERIIYVDDKQSFTKIVFPILNNIADEIGCKEQFKISHTDQKFVHENIAITSELFFAVYETSDEDMINDYEEILKLLQKQEPGVVDLFKNLIKGVILQNPLSIEDQIENEWDDTPLVDRLVYKTPIPLNEEQIKILKAVKMQEGKFILVEGPPGCGKSHTITAIAADCILHNKSCLVLSDKKEALDVVHDKINKTMDQVRHEEKFLNPILRLGVQNNFQLITSTSAKSKIESSVKSFKANKPKLDLELEQKSFALKNNISKTEELLKGLSISDLNEFNSLNLWLDGINSSLCTDLVNVFPIENVKKLAEDYDLLNKYLCNFAYDSQKVLFNKQVAIDSVISSVLCDLKPTDEIVFQSFSLSQLDELKKTLIEFDQLKHSIFGYLFKNSAIKKLESEILYTLNAKRSINLKNERHLLDKIIEISQKISNQLGYFNLSNEDFGTIFTQLVLQTNQNGSTIKVAPKLYELLKSFERKSFENNCFSDILKRYWHEKTYVEFAELWINSLRFIELKDKVLLDLPKFDYLSSKSELEKLYISRLNAEVDMRYCDYVKHYKGDAEDLRNLIKKKQKFPISKFKELKQSFPLILASIREFGKFMPLMPDLFDVVIIDEASQVSIAQALPAIIRAKKVVVLGDSNQYSNTKSYNSSNETNNKHKGELKKFFISKISKEQSDLTRLELFDVKKSVLDFVKYCANYSIMLRKHFRSYPELISFSSKNFYDGYLQALKIRACPISEVIKFSIIDTKGEKYKPRTNKAEIDFITNELYKILDSGKIRTVGIITPHTEQKKALEKTLFSDLRYDEFENKLKLKIMTFDTCQGEERQIIFYSMVATEENDTLSGIFPKNLENDVSEKLRLQRLNVGFSRAQEQIWFVLSKSPEKFTNSIAEVLRHYQSILNKHDVTAEDTDQSSPMEAEVLSWIKTCAFYTLHKEKIDLQAQFSIGEYLKQQDPSYDHPKYKCDFLLCIDDLKIIVEYDGYAYHFEQSDEIDQNNKEDYRFDEDRNRQYILESYGYKFLRLDKFKLWGKDPIDLISKELYELTSDCLLQVIPRSINDQKNQAAGLSSKKMKTCTRCKKIKNISSFESHRSRICKFCKRK